MEWVPGLGNTVKALSQLGVQVVLCESVPPEQEVAYATVSIVQAFGSQVKLPLILPAEQDRSPPDSV